jgi:hypothetical protein
LLRRWYNNELGSFGEHVLQPDDFAKDVNHPRLPCELLLLKQATVDCLQLTIGKVRNNLGNVGHK